MLVPSEKILSRRSLSQPHPHICLGGDCGACSLGGVLGISVPEVYAKFNSTGLTHVSEMDRSLRCALTYGLADRALDFFVDVAGWSNHWPCFGRPAYLASLQWFRVLQMAIDAGYYGVAEVSYERAGGPDTNHWVVLCGYRTRGCVSGETITGDLLMSCSVKGEEWIEAKTFLQTMGGYATRYLRPLNS
jgi:hypothetical protein